MLWKKLNLQQKIEFSKDLILTLLPNNRVLDKELEAWEDTLEVLKETDSVKKIEEFRTYISHQNNNG